MTTTLNGPSNARERKTLASQLDRLDKILDGLAEALNDSIADAVKDSVSLAVKEAIQAVLSEVLNNPEVLERLRALVGAPVAIPVAMPAPKPPRVTWRERLGRLCAGTAAKVSSVGQACRRGLGSLGRGAASLCGRTCSGVYAFVQPCRVLSPFRNQLLLALGIGMVTGVLVYFAGPVLAAMAGAVGGFATAVLVQAGLWWARFLGGWDLLPE